MYNNYYYLGTKKASVLMYVATKPQQLGMKAVQGLYFTLRSINAVD